jgi:hypothetical protein
MVICTYQAWQSVHCSADYANGIYLRQFRHLNDRMPDRHQVRAFCISYVGLTKNLNIRFVPHRKHNATSLEFQSVNTVQEYYRC